MVRMKPSRKGAEKKQHKTSRTNGEVKKQKFKGLIDEDYPLVKDVESDELKGKIAMDDPKLAKDITKFMKSLDFGSMRAAAMGEQDDVETDPSNIPEAPKKKEKTKEPVPSEIVKISAIAAKVVDSTQRDKLNFITPPTAQWYTTAPIIIPSTSRPSASPEYLASKSSQAATLIEKDASLYTESSSHTTSTADARFLSRVLTSGTLSDRLSALTLMVQGSPIHNIRALDSLKGMASKKGREESLKALRAIIDWWVGGGAPDRKLKYFRDQPITHPDVTDRHLIMWHFEDWLKKYFFAILQLLEGLSVDALPYIRTQAMHLVFQLLRDKPEQEQNLLRLLVNKLNDTEKAVASKASHHLLQLLQLHPRMKKIVVNEVSSFILRPTVTSTSSTQKPPVPEGNTHARYYAIITFNQIVLTPSDKEVAMKLVDVYFELFKELLGEDAPEEKVQEEDYTPKQRKGYKGKPNKKDHKGKGKTPDMAFQEVPDANSKLVSAILTGINRALPFAKTENSAAFDKHTDTLFRITHTATFSVSLQALMLIHHVSTSRPAIAMRFHRVLYASTLDPRLSASSKQAMYLNLVFKTLKADKDHSRVAAFVRRFLQTLGIHRPEFICGGLYLLGELFGTSPDIRNMTSVVRDVEDTYDPRKRDPQFAHAETSCLWELLPLLHHYHPSVSLHARQLLMHNQVTATADLGLNTLSHFLDRFVYRNAKKPRQKGASAMQPAAYDDGTATVHSSKTGRATDVVNADQFRKKREGDVPVDQVFFHKFFSGKHDKEQARAVKADKRKGKDKGDSDDDNDEASLGGVEDDSDPEEAEVWAAMKKSVPELAGSDIGDDSLPSDLDENDDDDEGSENADNDLKSLSDEGSDIDFIEDDDDIISDRDNPTGLLDYPSGDEGGESEKEWQGFGDNEEQKTRKRGREKEETRTKKKRQKLATFASYEDYAEMIDNAQEDDI